MIHHNNNLDTFPRHSVLKMSGGAVVFTKDTNTMSFITRSYIKYCLPFKTKAKVETKQDANIPAYVKIENETLEKVNSFKYLGQTIIPD